MTLLNLNMIQALKYITVNSTLTKIIVMIPDDIIFFCSSSSFLTSIKYLNKPFSIFNPMKAVINNAYTVIKSKEP